jgi:hypothetical protein
MTMIELTTLKVAPPPAPASRPPCVHVTRRFQRQAAPLPRLLSLLREHVRRDLYECPSNHVYTLVGGREQHRPAMSPERSAMLTITRRATPPAPIHRHMDRLANPLLSNSSTFCVSASATTCIPLREGGKSIAQRGVLSIAMLTISRRAKPQAPRTRSRMSWPTLFLPNRSTPCASVSATSSMPLWEGRDSIAQRWVVSIQLCSQSFAVRDMLVDPDKSYERAGQPSFFPLAVHSVRAPEPPRPHPW